MVQPRRFDARAAKANSATPFTAAGRIEQVGTRGGAVIALAGRRVRLLRCFCRAGLWRGAAAACCLSGDRARYTAQGAQIAGVPTTTSVTPCSPPSRTLRAASGGGLRPSSTAAARGVTPPRQVGTKKRPTGRTKKLTSKKATEAASVSL